MTVGSLFSGIGGIDLGFQRAGFEIAWQVEIDRQASSVLARHWPNVQRFEDVRKVGKKNLSKVDVIAGGFPCQDLSVAGMRGGLAGARSGLFWEMARITNELKPSFLVWENVPGLLSSDSGRDFARIVRGLADIGYYGAWRVLDAQFFGVPQRRRRVFGVFSRGRAGAERCAQILSLTAGVSRNHSPRRKTREGVAHTIRGRSSSRGVSAPGRGGEDDSNIVIAPAIRASGVGTERAGDTRGQDCLIVGSVSSKWAKGSGGPAGDECYNLVAHTLRGEGADASEDGTGRGTPLVSCTLPASDGGASSGMHPVIFAMQERMESTNPETGPQGKGYQDGIAFTIEARHRPQSVAGEIGVRRLTPRECDRLQGLPDDWTRWDGDGKEQKDRPRYKQIGNGVAVPVIEWIAQRIKDST